MSIFKKTYTLPFKYNIPNYTQEFLDNTSFFKRWIKFIKRYLYIYFKGQKNLEVFNITPRDKNILWVNISAPSLGDSLMDLSSRIMLKDRRIDLFTDKKNAHIYADDSIFLNVYTNLKDVSSSKYDLVIIDSYSSRSINIKSRVAPNTPFVGMFGYYNGPEVNRVLFSFHQMNHLLKYIKTESEINASAKNLINIPNRDQKIIKDIKLPVKFTAIVLGGEWNYRTYNQWEEVIKGILDFDHQTYFVFIGSGNAKNIATKLVNRFSKNNILDCVDQFSFNQTAQIIKQAQILLCCDGGLMNVTTAVNTVSIPLFARVKPNMRLTDAINNVFPLFDKSDVNNISPDDVLEKYFETISFVDNRPQDE